MKSPVVLIGMMGSGKTSVGRELARLLGWSWMDLDQTLEQRFGSSVARQFQADGEVVFRRRERDLLREACGSGPSVLSTGGGIVLDPLNRTLLCKQRTVYLRVSSEALWRRLKKTSLRTRPLLQGPEGAEAVLRRLARVRGPLYRSCAGITVLASHASVAAVARRVVRRLDLLPLTGSRTARILKKD